MSKRVRTIVIALIAVAVLGGALAAVLLLTEKPAVDDPTPEEDTSVTLSDTAAAVTKVEIALTGESFTIASQEDGVLGVTQYADLPVNADAVDALTGALQKLTANRKLDNPQADADYGLDKPAATLTATFADGATLALELGDTTHASEETYLRVKGKPEIYMVDETLSDTLTLPSAGYIGVSLMTAPEVEKDDENGQPVMRSITLTGGVRGDKPLTVRRTNTADSDTMRLYTYWVEQPFSRGANDTAATEAFSAAYSLTAGSAAFAHPTEQQKKDCGLDHPSTVAKIVTAVESKDVSNLGENDSVDNAPTRYYGVQNHTVTVGDGLEGDLYYVMVDDLDVIYLVSGGAIPWKDMGYNDIASTMLFLQDITGIGAITVVDQGNETRFILTHDPEAGNANDMLTVTVDGEQKDTYYFRQLYQVMMGIKRIGDADPPSTGQADMTIRIESTDTRDTVVEARLIRTSGSRYTCVMQDGDVYAVSAGSVEALQKQMAQYLAGKEVLVY
ncbi:MAG: DUF4340 domain-containing protein [Acutalibacteraceae bacterium]|jgi:hypothetical protein